MGCHFLKSNHFPKTELPYDLAQMVLAVKNLPANAGDIRDVGSVPGSGRSPGGGNGNPLQYSHLQNPMDGSLADYSPQGRKQLDTTEATCMQAPFLDLLKQRLWRRAISVSSALPMILMHTLLESSDIISPG